MQRRQFVGSGLALTDPMNLFRLNANVPPKIG